MKDNKFSKTNKRISQFITWEIALDGIYQFDTSKKPKIDCDEIIAVNKEYDQSNFYSLKRGLAYQLDDCWFDKSAHMIHYKLKTDIGGNFKDMYPMDIIYEIARCCLLYNSSLVAEAEENFCNDIEKNEDGKWCLSEAYTNDDFLEALEFISPLIPEKVRYVAIDVKSKFHSYILNFFQTMFVECISKTADQYNEKLIIDTDGPDTFDDYTISWCPRDKDAEYADYLYEQLQGQRMGF